MKNTAFLSLLAILFFSFASCKDDDQPLPQETDYLLFGHFYGLCAGEECIEIFKIENDQLFEDTQDNYPTQNNPYEGTFTALSDELFQAVKGLEDHIPNELLDEANQVFGQPDAADQGGYYFEISKNGTKQFWLIDTSKEPVPAYLHDFMDVIQEYIQAINS